MPQAQGDALSVSRNTESLRFLKFLQNYFHETKTASPESHICSCSTVSSYGRLGCNGREIRLQFYLEYILSILFGHIWQHHVNTIQVAAPGTKLILEKKSQLKSARQRNKNSQKEFGRQIIYFLDLEKDAGALDSPSFGMKTSLMKIQKAQYSME